MVRETAREISSSSSNGNGDPISHHLYLKETAKKGTHFLYTIIALTNSNKKKWQNHDQIDETKVFGIIPLHVGWRQLWSSLMPLSEALDSG